MYKANVEVPSETQVKHLNALRGQKRTISYC